MLLLQLHKTAVDPEVFPKLDTKNYHYIGLSRRRDRRVRPRDVITKRQLYLSGVDTEGVSDWGTETPAGPRTFPYTQFYF